MCALYLAGHGGSLVARSPSHTLPLAFASPDSGMDLAFNVASASGSLHSHCPLTSHGHQLLEAPPVLVWGAHGAHCASSPSCGGLAVRLHVSDGAQCSQSSAAIVHLGAAAARIARTAADAVPVGSVALASLRMPAQRRA